MAAQAAERVPVLERHVVAPAKIETIACTVNVGAEVHVEAPSPPQDAPAQAAEPQTDRELAILAVSLAEAAMAAYGSRRPCRVVRRRYGLNLEFSTARHVPHALIGAVRRAVSHGTGGRVSVEGRACAVDQGAIVAMLPTA